MAPLKSFIRTLLVTSALGLALTACREDDMLSGALRALPATLAGYPEPAYDSYGAYGGYRVDDGYRPSYGPAPVGRLVNYDDAWAWGERSYALDRAFYDTPPDYGFYYDDVEPWVWETEDDWAMYADPYEDDYRYYYYEPGVQRPYFIRDANYGYGYDNVGRLVVIFDLLGRLMPNSFLHQYDDRAGDYYRRAYQLRTASFQSRPILVSREVWLVREPVIIHDQSVWIQAATRQDDWIDYRTRTDEVFVRAFDDERRRRERRVADTDRSFFGLPLGRDRDERVRREDSIRIARADRRSDNREPSFANAEPDDRGFLGLPLIRDRDDEVRREDSTRIARADKRRDNREPSFAIAERDQRGFLGLPLGRGRDDKVRREESTRIARADRDSNKGVRGFPQASERRGKGDDRSLTAQAERDRPRAELRDKSRQAQAERMQQQARAETQERGRREQVQREQQARKEKQARQDQQRQQQAAVREQQAGKERQARQEQQRQQQAAVRAQQAGKERQARQEQQRQQQAAAREQQGQAQAKARAQAEAKAKAQQAQAQQAAKARGGPSARGESADEERGKGRGGAKG